MDNYKQELSFSDSPTKTPLQSPTKFPTHDEDIAYLEGFFGKSPWTSPYRVNYNYNSPPRAPLKKKREFDPFDGKIVKRKLRLDLGPAKPACILCKNDTHLTNICRFRCYDPRCSNLQVHRRTTDCKIFIQVKK